MEENHNEHSVVELPSVVFYGLLTASVLGGAGGYSVLGPQIERTALQSCYDNSSTALSVAAQHGEEFNEVRAAIAENRRLIYDKTQARWTADDEHKAQREQSRIDAVQDRRLDYIERKLDD